MRRHRIALACLALGCGRLEFDSLDAAIDTAGPDITLANHDEDADGLDDAIDPCPPHPGTLDTDGDGLPDGCDPTLGLDQLVVFSPLTTGTSPFDDISNAMQEMDSLRLVGDNALTIKRPIVSMRIEIGFEILALEANPQKQLAIGIEGTTPFYFAELNDDAGQKNLDIASYDPTNLYQYLDMTPLAAGVHTGRGIFSLDVTSGTSPQFRVLGGWVGEQYTALAATPAYDAGDAIRFVFNGLDVRIEYVLLVASN